MFMGLGDIVIPSLLVISASSFIDHGGIFFGLRAGLWVALGTIIGIMGGFIILMHFVNKGRPQAGLPLLNSGAIIGYLLSYLIVIRDFAFGINLDF